MIKMFIIDMHIIVHISRKNSLAYILRITVWACDKNAEFILCVYWL